MIDYDSYERTMHGSVVIQLLLDENCTTQKKKEN